ncbi:MAG: hypothetical protein M3474_02050 [Actinomycetota bacterium]|nr:hypothetical protein [Actinomycetota bacterium]
MAAKLYTMSDMSATDVRPASPLDASPHTARSPAAIRLRRPGWRDPRLAVGLLLVAASTLIGARVLAAVDESVSVWVTADAVRAGDEVADVELVPGRALLKDGASATVYLGTGTEPAGVFDRDLQAGELVPAGALQSPGAQPRTDVPLSVDVGAAPVNLAVGDEVDVWVVPTEDVAVGSTAAQRVLRGVPVTVAGEVDALGSAGRQVVVRLAETSSARRLGEILGAIGNGRVVLVRVGG